MWWMEYYSLPRPTALKPRYHLSLDLHRSRATYTIQLFRMKTGMQIIVNLFYHSVLNHIHILLPTTLLWLCDNICLLLLLLWHITWISALHISSLLTNTTIVRSCLYHCHARYLFKDICNTMQYHARSTHILSLPRLPHRHRILIPIILQLLPSFVLSPYLQRLHINISRAHCYSPYYWPHSIRDTLASYS